MAKIELNNIEIQDSTPKLVAPESPQAMERMQSVATLRENPTPIENSESCFDGIVECLSEAAEACRAIPAALDTGQREYTICPAGTFDDVECSASPGNIGFAAGIVFAGGAIAACAILG